MADCKGCSSSKIDSYTLPKYEDKLLGLPFPAILIDAVIEEKCRECGKIIGHTIPNLEGLIAAAAVGRALCPLKLRGADISFLRKALDWKAKELAEYLGHSPEHISKCENSKRTLSASDERAIRLFVCVYFKDEAPLISWEPEELRSMKLQPVIDVETPIEFRFSLVKIETTNNEEGKWQKAA